MAHRPDPTPPQPTSHVSQLLGEVAGWLLRWIDAGRSSLVVALALALALPSVDVVAFDGLPFDRIWEFTAFAALLPFVFSSALREALGSVLGRRGGWGPRVAFAAVTAVVVAKLLLLAFGADQGFVGCYRASAQAPDTRCEISYSNLFDRHEGATRIDETIDFGPSEAQASKRVRTYSTLVYTGGAASTDWNLSFANDLRFNEGLGSGASRHELMPFTATWQGTAAIPDEGVVEIAYVGEGRFEIGGKRIVLPMANEPRTVRARVPAGEQPLSAAFGSPDEAPAAELRLLDRSGGPIGAAAPSLSEELAAGLVWLVLVAMFGGLALIALRALGRDLWLLAAVVIACCAVTVLTAPGEQIGFQYVAALLAPAVVWLTPRRPLLWVYAALVALAFAGIANSGAELGSVLYRASGTDFLTYESLGREVYLNGLLNGGEDVFYYQPGSRYLLGLLHVLFGDGDVIVTAAAMLALSLPFLALLVWQRRRVDSTLGLVVISAAGFLLLAVLNSPTILSLVTMAASEVPTWTLLPLAVAAPQLQPQQRGAWIGSSVAAAAIWVVRNNQAFAVVTILAAIAARLWREHRRTLVAGLAAAVVIGLLPAIHNLAYGDRLILSTTSSAVSKELAFVDLGQLFSDTLTGSELRGHISAIFYDPPNTELASGNLRWLLWGILALWIGAIVTAAMRLLRGQRLSLSGWLLLFLPVTYLAPHILYQVEVYYPRHITAGYLAMGLGAIGAFAELSRGGGGLWRHRYAGRASLPPLLADARGRLTAMTGRAFASGAGAWAGLERRWQTTAAFVWPTAFRWTGLGLASAAFLAPFSATNMAGPLTVGRLAVLFFAALLALDLLRERPWSFRPDPAAILLVGAYVGLVGWIFVSSATLGCNCDGKAGGFYEFAAIGVLAIAAIGLEPRLRGVAAVATLAGISFAALLALAGVGSINSGTVDLTQTGGRLSGTFGNANELGFAAALGLPLALAYLSLREVWARVAAGAAALVLVLVLVLTFSRGAVIAAAVGTLALALWQARGSRRRVGTILAAAAVAVAIGGALYAVFERERQDVSFTAVPTTLRPLDQRDVSGWDSRALGPIPNGPSVLANGRAGIVVGPGRSGEGASFRWGEAASGGAYTLRFRARSPQPGLEVEYALADSVQGGGALARARLGPRWQRFTLDWRPARGSSQATLYIWRPRGRAAFAVDDVSVLAREPGAPARAIAAPGRLEGSLYDSLTGSAEREEERYIESRLDAAELAWQAFRSAPLQGIGWSSFPDYSAEHGDYGELAAHNEYLAFAAELGLIGLLLLALALAAVVLGVRRSGPTRAEAAAIGVLAATAAGLVFVEALPVPQLSITIALAAAIVCARGGTRRSGADRRRS